MALDAFLDSSHTRSRAMPQVSRGLMLSSGPNNLLHKDEQFQSVLASFSSQASRNFLGADAGISNFNLDKYCGAANQTAVHSASNLTGNIVESYLVPESISAVSKDPLSHRTSTANIDSHVDFFKLPVLSSHDMNGSTSVKDPSFVVQDVSYKNDSRGRKRKQNPGNLSAASSGHASQKHEDSLPDDIKQELHNLCIKKPRLDLNQDAMLRKYIIKQLMENQDSLQLQGQMAQLKEPLQWNKLQNEHRGYILQSLPLFQGVEVKQNACQQIRHHFRQPDICQAPVVPPFGGVCARRLMQYMYHLRNRPPENGIEYWRKFVKEYYAPHAKKRWCLSLYDNVGPSSGVFCQAAVAQWHCDLCGSKSGKGFEVASEVLPRLNKVSFESGVIDEILFLNMPREHRLPSGLLMLEYEKAVQESVYDKFHVVREGKLRITFTYDLKIFSWEFCSRHHEELLQRSSIIPQVSRLINAAQKYQSTISGSYKVSPHDLQEDCNRFLNTGCELARNFDLQLTDDLGFSERFIRCLQIAGVVEIMKDLMTFSRDNKIGPVESLKKYPRHTTSTNPMRSEEKEKSPLESFQSLPSDCNKLMSLPPDSNNSSNGSLNISCNLHSNGSEAGAPKQLSRQTSNASKWKKAPSRKCNISKEDASTKPFNGPKASSLGLSQDLQVNDLSNYNFSESSKNIQEYMIQKWLQEMVSNSRSENKGDKERLNQRIVSTTPISGLQTKAKAMRTDKLISGLNFDRTVSAAAAPTNLSLTGQNMQNGSTAFVRESWGFTRNEGFIKGEEDLPEMAQNMIHDYYKSGNPCM